MAWQLVRSGHLVRSLRLAPFATGIALAAGFLAVRHGEPHDVIADLRVLGLLLALSSGFVLDDGAAVTLQASPYSLAHRLWLRIGCAAAVVVPLWTAMLAGLLSSAPVGDRWALGLGLTVELTAVLAVSWAVAAWGRRYGFEHPGIVTTPAIMNLLLLATSIPEAPMLVASGTEWTPAHLRWLGILVGATCVLVAAMRDPATRWRSPSRHPSRERQRV